MEEDILKDYIKIEIKKNDILLSVIPKKNFVKRFEVRRKIKYLNKKRILLS